MSYSLLSPQEQQQQQQQDILKKQLKVPAQKLEYSIHACSSYSSSYLPANILVNRPQDQSSRWSSGSNNQMQFITLKLAAMSVVQTITFGKYHKVHVCNLKEFKVYGGMTPNHMLELLHSGLRNDSEQETFALKYSANGVVFPCLYLKIVPLLAWGANFNFSIWYTELRGISQPEIVELTHQQYSNYRETEVIRLCLKHFRQRNHLDSFQLLQERTNMQLEDPLLTDLHRHLVVNGDFDGAEELLIRAASRDLFDDYISCCVYKPVWNLILPTDTESLVPSKRGGHQMCIDSDGTLFLFGGWDGARDLSDFWAFEESTRQWRCISMDTRKQSGPGPRSCHKICYDPWTRLSSNTAQEGGPELIYDHQMIVDADHQILYVFGGRTIGPDVSQTVYSGLYSYSIATNQWRLISTDTSQPENTIQLKSRIGHSMLLNPNTRELYIFAGQRNKEYLSDFYVYEMDTDTIREIARDYTKSGGPDAGFTQRATIDTDFGEFYVLSGLMREKNSTQETVRNSFWVYSIKRNQWSRVYQNENISAEYWANMADKEPRPRFAHQLVYNPKLKCQYLFGGNPGEIGNPNLRLDDLWELRLVRPTTEDVLRRAIFQIRRQKFTEMCQNSTANPFSTLQYLQTQVSLFVNHEDETESKAFRDLSSSLFRWTPPCPAESTSTQSGTSTDGMPLSGAKDMYALRTQLYESLLEFFPDSMRDPKENLVDLVPMC
ncbi:hypothetical protein BASA61_005038 [Batrachochytrium salamandrivorans]|nr:hypothetical protein BASA61_005038 [Batrachochytrium salamandrivorans]